MPAAEDKFARPEEQALALRASFDHLITPATKFRTSAVADFAAGGIE
jgi:hypothetical protein